MLEVVFVVEGVDGMRYLLGAGGVGYVYKSQVGNVVNVLRGGYCFECCARWVVLGMFCAVGNVVNALSRG